MRDSCQCKSKALITASVISNVRMGPRLYRLRLKLTGEGMELFSHFIPGQFAQFDIHNIALPKNCDIPEYLIDKSMRYMILRRPFSFADVISKEMALFAEVMYLVLGPGSLRMTTLKEHDEINLIGPLGRGFWVPEGKNTAIIVAGGMGAPPLQHLGKFLTANYSGLRVYAFAGAKTRDELPFSLTQRHDETELSLCLEEFARDGIESFIATDDGSLGFKGYVTACLANWLDKTHLDRTKAVIYTCGPDQMLSAVTKLAAQENIDCQVSMERLMGCGIGVCQSCAVECKTSGSDETFYKLCCQDGPVFDSKEVVWK